MPYRISLLMTLILLSAQAAQAWVLELTPRVTLDRPVIRLTDVVASEAPTTAGALVLRTGGKPGETVEISRAAILRRLVTERLSVQRARSSSLSCVNTKSSRSP